MASLFMQCTNMFNMFDLVKSEMLLIQPEPGNSCVEQQPFIVERISFIVV